MPAVTEGRFHWRITTDVSYLEPAVLYGQPRLRCAFTLRQAGTSGRELNLSFDRGPRPEVLANRQRLLQALGLGHTALYTVRQVHGNAVCVVDAQAIQHGLQGIAADALVTVLPDVTLGVLVADCLPIVLYTLDPLVLGVVHAGRMGTYHRVVSRTLAVMQQRFGVMPAQVFAVFGPAIGACCYTLDARAVRPFREQFSNWAHFFAPQGTGRWTMHLAAANAAQLQAAGVPTTHLQMAQVCTVCHNQHLYSHRAEGQEAGRCMGLAALLGKEEQ